MHLLFVFLHLNFEEEIKGYSTLRPFRMKIQLNGVWSGSSASGNTTHIGRIKQVHPIKSCACHTLDPTPHHISFFYLFIYTNPHLWSLYSPTPLISLFFLYNLISLLSFLLYHVLIILLLLRCSCPFPFIPPLPLYYGSYTTYLFYYCYFLIFLIYNFVHSLTIKNIEISANEVDTYGHIFHLY